MDSIAWAFYAFITAIAVAAVVVVAGHAVFRTLIGLAMFNSLFAMGYALMMPVFLVASVFFMK